MRGNTCLRIKGSREIEESVGIPAKNERHQIHGLWCVQANDKKFDTGK